MRRSLRCGCSSLIGFSTFALQSFVAISKRQGGCWRLACVPDSHFCVNQFTQESVIIVAGNYDCPRGKGGRAHATLLKHVLKGPYEETFIIKNGTHISN